jgi:hypothetical protein
MYYAHKFVLCLSCKLFINQKKKNKINVETIAEKYITMDIS